MLDLRFIVERNLPSRDVQGQLSLKEAAAAFKLSRQSAAKWVARFRQSGLAGLPDRTSRPRRFAPPHSTHRWWNAWSLAA